MLQRLKTLPIDRVFVVANGSWPASLDTLDRPILILPDERPNAGALGGIATGLRACIDWGIALACDLPLVNPAVVQYLCTLVKDDVATGETRWQAIVPLVDGFAQTLHALYHRSILPVIDQQLAGGDLRTHHILQNVRTRWVSENELRPLDPELRSFINANTPEEWAKACKLLET
jgi:molybdopterin-guanine dinucleotide biosynthesis protein A